MKFDIICRSSLLHSSVSVLLLLVVVPSMLLLCSSWSEVLVRCSLLVSFLFNLLVSFLVFVYRGFITEEECDHLIPLAHGQKEGTNSVISDTQGVSARSLVTLDL
ncbi:hypothetical protein SOVF_116910, partial [Spinacia oleracea]